MTVDQRMRGQRVQREDQRTDPEQIINDDVRTFPFTFKDKTSRGKRGRRTVAREYHVSAKALAAGLYDDFDGIVIDRATDKQITIEEAIESVVEAIQ